MILQALVDCYEALSASGKIARPGWGPVKTSIALELTETGEISQAIFLKEEEEKGKKKDPGRDILYFDSASGGEERLVAEK